MATCQEVASQWCSWPKGAQVGGLGRSGGPASCSGPLWHPSQHNPQLPGCKVPAGTHLHGDRWTWLAVAPRSPGQTRTWGSWTRAPAKHRTPRELSCTLTVRGTYGRCGKSRGAALRRVHTGCLESLPKAPGCRFELGLSPHGSRRGDWAHDCHSHELRLTAFSALSLWIKISHLWGSKGNRWGRWERTDVNLISKGKTANSVKQI